MKKRLSCFVLTLCMLFSLFPALPLTTEAASTVKASDAVSVARSLIGYKYVWGGKSPSAGGFDCSGLIYYIYHDKLGYDIAYSQIQSRSALLKVGTKITNVKDFLPGDIIHGTASGNLHLGLCTGNGKMIDAGTSKGVSERAYQNSWWKIDYAVRLPGVTQGSSTTSSSGKTTVYLDTCGGTCSVSSIAIGYGEYWSLPTPKRDGYTFCGWFSEKNGNGSNYTNDGKFWGVEEQKTVYAHWKSNKTTVYLDACGGTCSVSSILIGYGEYWSLPTPKRDGYTFCGWFSEKSGNGSNYTNDGRFWGIEEQKTVYAHWIKNEAIPVNPVTPSPSIKEVHFPKVTTYTQGQFSDVPPAQWFTDNVADAVSFGLMKGNANGTFNPYGDVTIAEAVTIAARLHSIYTTGSEYFTQSDVWYQCYLDYAYQNGIISNAYYTCDVKEKATRAQFAEIFANALPSVALPAISTVADNAIPDVKTSAPSAPYVYKLYRAGILTGGDVKGTFSPLTYITRAECATIVARMADSDNRVEFTLN